MSENSKSRIWELDFIRGIAIIGVVIVHFLVDILLFTDYNLNLPPLFYFVKNYGSIIFIVLSGICVTLGRNNIKRGVIVFLAGIIITVVTLVMFKNFDDAIVFGVLHFLGISMILSPLLKKLPIYLLAILTILLLLTGYYFQNISVNTFWLIPLGLMPYGYNPMDYFPLLPYIGYFTLGIITGKTVYKNKTTKFPKINYNNFIIKFFIFCGRKSLWIYLLHQPIEYLIVILLFPWLSLLLK